MPPKPAAFADTLALRDRSVARLQPLANVPRLLDVLRVKIAPFTISETKRDSRHMVGRCGCNTWYRRAKCNCLGREGREATAGRPRKRVITAHKIIGRTYGLLVGIKPFVVPLGTAHEAAVNNGLAAIDECRDELQNL